MAVRIWRMPPPPLEHVISVFDCKGVEWHRVTENGVWWRSDERGSVLWDELVFRAGPIREGVLAA